MVYLNGKKIVNAHVNGIFTVDEELSTESTNPIANKAVAEKFSGTIRFWQPNTEYKVGDYCYYYTIGYDATDESRIFECKKDHTSGSSMYDEIANWDALPIYAVRSIRDSNDNVIVETYVTKDELSNNHYTKDEVNEFAQSFVTKGELESDYYAAVVIDDKFDALPETYATKEEVVGTLGTINEVLATLVEVE